MVFPVGQSLATRISSAGRDLMNSKRRKNKGKTMSSRSKQYFAFFFAAFLVSGLSRPLRAQAQLYNRVRPISIKALEASMIFIETKGPQGMSSGSGVVTVILGKKYVLTTNHVIRGTYAARLTSLADGKYGYANSTGGWHVDFDVAAIPLPESLDHLPAMSFCDSKPLAGSRIYIAAFPKGVPAITFGRVAGYGHHGTEMYHTAATNGGSSGGMIIDNKGRLCGIHQGVLPASGYKYALPTDVIIRLVSRHGRK